MHGVRHIVLAGIVHEVKHHQALLAGGQPHSAAQLLGIEYSGHGRTGHEQHLGSRAVPTFVEQIAGTQHLDLALFKPGQHLPAVTGFDLTGHGLGCHTGIAKPPSDLLGVFNRSTEDNSPLVLHILQPGVHNELVALRHIDLALQIPDVVLDAVVSHLGQVDVGMDADAPHRHQLADLHSGLNVQLVGGVLEDIQNVLVVGPLRRSGQSQGKFRRKVGQHLLVCIGGGMMSFVHNDVTKVIRPEPLQVQRHALNTAADHKGICLLHILCIAAYGDLRPQFPEHFGSLIHQLHRMSQKQRSFAEAFGIHNSSNRFAGSGGVVEQGDGLKIAAHLLQRREGLFLVFLQLQLRAVQRFAPLGGEIVLDLPEAGVLAQEDPQLVLDSLGLLLHLPYRPTVHIPA